MFIASLLVNGVWNDQFTTNRPTKDLIPLRDMSEKVSGCTLCGILNPETRELMCYVYPRG